MAGSGADNSDVVPAAVDLSQQSQHDDDMHTTEHATSAASCVTSPNAQHSADNSEVDDEAAADTIHTPASSNVHAPPSVSGSPHRGSSCHQCKNIKPHSSLACCTHVFAKRTKPDTRTCRKKYCDSCLAKYYNVLLINVQHDSQWVCASCRGVCSCAACQRMSLRKRKKVASAMSAANAVSAAVTGHPATISSVLSAAASNALASSMWPQQPSSSNPSLPQPLVYTAQALDINEMQQYNNAAYNNLYGSQPSGMPMQVGSPSSGYSTLASSASSASSPMDVTAQQATQLRQFQLRQQYMLQQQQQQQTAYQQQQLFAAAGAAPQQVQQASTAPDTAIQPQQQYLPLQYSSRFATPSTNSPSVPYGMVGAPSSTTLSPMSSTSNSPYIAAHSIAYRPRTSSFSSTQSVSSGGMKVPANPYISPNLMYGKRQLTSSSGVSAFSPIVTQPRMYTQSALAGSVASQQPAAAQQQMYFTPQQHASALVQQPQGYDISNLHQMYASPSFSGGQPQAAHQAFTSSITTSDVHGAHHQPHDGRVHSAVDNLQRLANIDATSNIA